MGTRERASTVSGQSSFLPVDAEGDKARLEFVGRLKKKDIKVLKKAPRWLVVGRGGLKAHVLYFPEPSKFGIDGGKISKLAIVNEDRKTLVNFDRGWDVQPPESGKARDFYDDILSCE